MAESSLETYCLSISNIAWPAEHDFEAIKFIAKLGFEGVELAPVKIFGDLYQITSAKLRAYREKVATEGLRIPALQGIFFGTEGVNLFGSGQTRSKMTSHLTRVAEVAAELGARACVFGAPTLRNPGDMTAEAAHDVAVAFFANIASIYAKLDVKLCFEANPEIYGCNFVTRTDDAVKLVKAVDLPGVAVQLDTGTIFVNKEDPNIIVEAGSQIGHFHISEPSLASIGTARVDHGAIATALRASAYRGWVSVEMKAAPDWQSALQQAYDLVKRTYI